MAKIGEVKRSSTTVCEFEWSISTEIFNGHYTSSVFTVFGDSCYLGIDPNRFKSSTPSMTQNDEADYVGLFLRVDSSPMPSIVPEVSFAIINADGNKDQERRNPIQILNSDRIIYACYYYISRDELLERASELMPSGILTIVCTIRYPKSIHGRRKLQRKTSTCMHCGEMLDVKGISFHEKSCYLKRVKCPQCSKDVLLRDWSDHVYQSTKKSGEVGAFKSSAVPHVNSALNDFKELFLQKEDCDVVLKVKDQDFPAHRSILKARSAVFASTFRSDMKEKATGVVEIDDCDPSCFSDFLCFLYCADVSLISQENVFSLFTAADKYHVQDLRDICMEFVKQNLSVDTFCDTMTLALLHLETELIELSTDFFTKNAPDIILTVKWQVFLAENPTQCNELLVKLLKPGSSVKK